ncbi:DNA-deoxyinosine glycosylase [Helicobacter burdigaliensis]|uniref:DNA-deoxyinosine glycosylase n=1 Tax=Helicobacter burdigaliensis TaxID=2315334 RepID=UPI000EF7553F|nr:DNA-deoxyinosine glycosylase [Helicobacter burdigaliensis]
MKNNQKIITTHAFNPIFNQDSKVLILGSFPSLASESFGFYYGNSNNRFWSVLALVLDEVVPTSKDKHLKNKEIIEIQRNFLLAHHIALWDCVQTCKRKANNSSDTNLEIISFNDITKIVYKSQIKAIFCNGKLASKTFLKLQSNTLKPLNIPCFTLPSTSSANARYNLEDLKTKWSVLKNFLL